MQQELTRYLFIGEFDSVLMGLYSKRGEVIWVSSFKKRRSNMGKFFRRSFKSNRQLLYYCDRKELF
jgi:chemotaxis signal transduction protein